MKAHTTILLVISAICAASCSTSSMRTMPQSDGQSLSDLQRRQISAFEEAVRAPDTLIALRDMPVAGWALRNPQYLTALKDCKPTGQLQPTHDDKSHLWRQWECDNNNEFVEQDFRGATVGTSYVFKKQWLIEINIDLTYGILVGGRVVDRSFTLDTP